MLAEKFKTPQGCLWVAGFGVFDDLDELLEDVIRSQFVSLAFGVRSLVDLGFDERMMKELLSHHRGIFGFVARPEDSLSGYEVDHVLIDKAKHLC